MVGIPTRSVSCLTCRRRKKKCDKRTPTCIKCERAGIECEGYTEGLVWVNRTVDNRPNPQLSLRQHQQSQQQQQQQHKYGSSSNYEQQLVLDNDSGTYRPEKSVLPDLKAFFEKNFPGMGVVTMHWEDEELQQLKEAQHSAKKKEGKIMRGVMNRSMSSLSSAESELEDRQENWEATKSKREKAWDAMEQPSTVKDKMKSALH
ncbi:hypothetical protein NQ176_g5916 [Zarea fungicola]|uniref:Uncharacterized protein n=1 Tax=Zarea fungicola TaxID=93591 RepID=A0ACC1N8C4_9HYPO|nr:hypothetical protein NQ176_g5916 [Lecanicillium fungicola]